MKKIFLIAFYLFSLSPCLAQAQWQLSSTDGSGPFATIGTRLYAAGGDGPMLWTSDAGDTWHDASSDLPGGEGIQSIASIGNVLIAGSGPYNVPFYFSTDSGASWNPSNWHQNYGPAIFAMIEHDGYVFAGSNGSGIYRSSDSGRDWELKINGITWIPGAYSFAAYDSLLFAGSPSGEVYRTSDDGNNWQVVPLEPITPAVVQALTVIGKTVIAGTNDGAYRSTDLGLTWKELDTAFFRHGLFSIVTQAGTLIAGLFSTVIRSGDSGQSWRPFDQGAPSGEGTFSLTAFDSYFFADYYAGLWRRPLSDLAGVNQAEAIPPDSLVVSFYNSWLTVTSHSLIHSVSIFDVMGRTLSRVESHGTSVKMDLHGLANGVYFVRITTDAEISVHKIDIR